MGWIWVPKESFATGVVVATVWNWARASDLAAGWVGAVPVLQLGLPDQFVAHGSREQLLADCGLDAAGVLRAIQARLRLLAKPASNGDEDNGSDRGRA